MPLSRTTKFKVKTNRANGTTAHLDGKTCRHVYNELEGVELEQCVKSGISRNSKLVPANSHLEISTELDRIRSYREVRFQRHLQNVIIQFHSHALHIREIEAAFGLILRVETTGRQYKSLSVSGPVNAQGHIAIKVDTYNMGIV